MVAANDVIHELNSLEEKEKTEHEHGESSYGCGVALTKLVGEFQHLVALKRAYMPTCSHFVLTWLQGKRKAETRLVRKLRFTQYSTTRCLRSAWRKVKYSG